MINTERLSGILLHLENLSVREFLTFAAIPVGDRAEISADPAVYFGFLSAFTHWPVLSSGLRRRRSTRTRFPPEACSGSWRRRPDFRWCGGCARRRPRRGLPDKVRRRA